MKRLPSRGRRIHPALITAGVSLATGLIQQQQQKKELKRQQGEYFQDALDADRALLENYDISGKPVEQYANGGKLPVNPTKKFNPVGGKLVPLAEDTVEVKGNEHGEKTIGNQYGVTLKDAKTGNPIVEVEDKEIIAGDAVFSNRLKFSGNKSFAAKMKELSIKKGKLEEKLENTNSKIERNGIERTLAGINMAEEQLYKMQEEVAAKEGQEILQKGEQQNIAVPEDPQEINENGLPVMSTGGDIAPYMDNAVNLALTLTAPKLPKPHLLKRKKLDTTVNVNPQLSAIKKTVKNMDKAVIDNTSNSTIARANLLANKFKGVEATVDVLGKKQELEKQLNNQQIEADNAINTANTNTINQYEHNKFIRKGDIASSISANATDLGKDISNQAYKKDILTSTDDAVYASLLDDETGEKLEAILNSPAIKNNPKLLQRVLDLQKQKNSKNEFNSEINRALSKPKYIRYGDRLHTNGKKS